MTPGWPRLTGRSGRPPAREPRGTRVCSLSGQREYAILVDKTVAALKAMREVVEEGDITLTLPVELRWVARYELFREVRSRFDPDPCACQHDADRAVSVTRRRGLASSH